MSVPAKASTIVMVKVVKASIITKCYARGTGGSGESGKISDTGQSWRTGGVRSANKEREDKGVKGDSTNR